MTSEEISAVTNCTKVAGLAASVLGFGASCVDVIVAQFILEKGWGYWAAYPTVEEFNISNTGVVKETLTSPGAGITAYAYTLLISNPTAYQDFVIAGRQNKVTECLDALASSPWANPPYGQKLQDVFDMLKQPVEVAQQSSPAPKVVTIPKGGNLWDIAQAHGFTVQDLLRVNPNITNPSLVFPGETINLP